MRLLRESRRNPRVCEANGRHSNRRPRNRTIGGENITLRKALENMWMSSALAGCAFISADQAALWGTSLWHSNRRPG